MSNLSGSGVDFNSELRNLVGDAESLIAQVKQTPSIEPGKRDKLIDGVTSSLANLTNDSQHMSSDLNRHEAHLSQIENLLGSLEYELTGTSPAVSTANSIRNNSRSRPQQQQLQNSVRSASTQGSTQQLTNTYGSTSRLGIQQQRPGLPPNLPLGNSASARMLHNGQDRTPMSASGGVPPDMTTLKSLQKTNAKLRVQIVSAESELKRVSQELHKLQKEHYDKDKRLQHAEKNFKSATHRNWHMNNTQHNYEKEISDLTNLIELVIEDQKTCQNRLQSQVQEVGERHVELEKMMRDRNRFLQEKTINVMARKVDLSMVRMCFVMWGISTANNRTSSTSGTTTGSRSSASRAGMQGLAAAAGDHSHIKHQAMLQKTMEVDSDSSSDSDD